MAYDRNSKNIYIADTGNDRILCLLNNDNDKDNNKGGGVDGISAADGVELVLDFSQAIQG